MTVDKTYSGFIVVSNSSALGLTMSAVKYLAFPLDRVRDHGYEGALVMSGRLGVQKQFAALVRKTCGYAVPVPFVHCASHNLNLEINDSVETTISSQTFFGTIEEGDNTAANGEFKFLLFLATWEQI